MNLRVIQRDNALRKTEKILRTIRFVVLARYDEDSKHWNYLRIKGPMFLIVDTFGAHRLVILNHYTTENQIIPINRESEIKFESLRLDFGEGFMLNYMTNDSIRRSIFGIWSADETILELEREINGIIKN